MGVVARPGHVHPLTGGEITNVRTATVDDAQVIASLGASIRQLHHAKRPDWFKPVDDNVIARMYRDRVLDPTDSAFLAEEDEMVLGFVIVEVHTGPETPLGWAQTTLSVDQIGLAPSQRRRGIGHELLDAVRHMATRVATRRIVVTTWDFNVDAHRFFEAEGFETEMRRMSLPWPSSSN